MRARAKPRNRRAEPSPARSAWLLAACAVPLLYVLYLWLSPLAFTPVPWPDDSAFYFVAHELFKWPPRWVMLPQAPFEPTYHIWNFNTMPLYPILIGLGRLVGIDGSFALKFWPLAAFAATGTLLIWVLSRAGLPLALASIAGIALIADPNLRWASVLVRPESLIGLIGMALTLGLTLGFPRRLETRRLWDPVAALLALGAYIHFNAIHLLFPTLAALQLQPRRLFGIGWRCVLYLAPWIATVLWHFPLFVKQMGTQWKRLAVPNGWLSSPDAAIRGLFPDLGNPGPWPGQIYWAGKGIWLLIFLALAFGLVLPAIVFALRESRFGESLGLRGKAPPLPALTSREPSLVPTAAWVLGGLWLWTTKPEVWFTSLIHFPVWTFAGVLMLRLWKHARPVETYATGGLCAAVAGVFFSVNIEQASDYGSKRTWRWETYYDFVGCVEDRLEKLEEELGRPQPFRVWCPTFPDITIELSRRHRDWEFTRTNDFHERIPLALQHGREVEAVVITEALNWPEREITGPQSENPDTRSVWMLWKEYYLNRFWEEAGWKPNRWLCQRGRWQAFLFMEPARSGKGAF